MPRQKCRLVNSTHLRFELPLITSCYKGTDSTQAALYWLQRAVDNSAGSAAGSASATSKTQARLVHELTSRCIKPFHFVRVPANYYKCVPAPVLLSCAASMPLYMRSLLTWAEGCSSWLQ